MYNPCRVFLVLFSMTVLGVSQTVVSGTVRDQTGVGIAGVTIEFLDSGVTTATLTGGTFSVAVPSGTEVVQFVPPLTPLRAPHELTGIVIAGATQNLGIITLQPGVMISGTARVNGVALVGGDTDAFDSITGAKLFTPNDNTGTGGVFSLVVPIGGTYDIEVDPLAGTLFVAALVTNVAAPANVNIGIVNLAPGVTLSGTVRNAATNANLNLVDIDVTDQATGQRIPTPNDNTNTLGVFSVIVPPSRTYRVAFDPAPGVAIVGREIQNIVVGAANLTMPITFLSPGFVVSGTLLGPTGLPLAMGDLDCEQVLGPIRFYISNDSTLSNGAFATVVPAGSFRFFFEPPLSEPNLVPQIVGPVNVTSNVNLGTITLPAGVLLQGNVNNYTGNPEGNCDINVIDPVTGAIVETPADNTDDFGNYSVRVPVGTWNVLFSTRKGSLARDRLVNGVVVAGPVTILNTTLVRTPIFVFMVPTNGAVPLVLAQGSPLFINAAIWNTDQFTANTGIVRALVIDPAGVQTTIFPVVPISLSPFDFLLGLSAPIPIPPAQPAHLGLPFKFIIRMSDPLTGEEYDSDVIDFIIQ